MENVERRIVDTPIVLVKGTRTDVSGLDQRILARKMKDMKMDRVFLAKKQTLDDVHLNGRFRGTFLPERKQILGIRIPNHGGRGWNTEREKSFLQREKLTMAGRQGHFVRRQEILKEEFRLSLIHI